MSIQPTRSPSEGAGSLQFMIRLVILGVLVIQSIYFASPATAAQAKGAGATIIVGGDRDYPPYEFLDKNGQPAGYNVELTKAIAAVMGMRGSSAWAPGRRCARRCKAARSMSWKGCPIRRAASRRSTSPSRIPSSTMPSFGVSTVVAYSIAKVMF